MLGRIRSLSDRYQQGGTKAFGAFQDLASLLLHLTVLDETSQVRLTGLKGKRRTRAALGGPAGPTDPLVLTNGLYLRLSVSLYLDPATGRLKVETSSYQYQADREGEHWFFRYDYLREPGPDPYPTAHLQVCGRLEIQHSLPKGKLEAVHFPTGRVSLEAVIRLLAEQFDVPTRSSPELWRSALAESERLFAEIAHRPVSGPDR